VDSPYTIFSTTGFRSWDDMYRGFEDMGSEPGGGGGWSKTHFYMFCACEINFFTKSKNIGMMYALGHNGLINMGAAGPDGPDQLFRTPYIQALSSGMDFGQAFIYAIKQTSWFNPASRYYNLLGAGTLRSQPYIQYGSYVIADQIFNNGLNIFNMNAVLIRNVTVNGNGTLQVNAHSSSFGIHSEIVVRPETVFSPTGTNEVHLKAY
jgi:hypothetical protein